MSTTMSEASLTLPLEVFPFTRGWFDPAGFELWLPGVVRLVLDLEEVGSAAWQLTSHSLCCQSKLGWSVRDAGKFFCTKCDAAHRLKAEPNFYYDPTVPRAGEQLRSVLAELLFHSVGDPLSAELLLAPLTATVLRLAGEGRDILCLEETPEDEAEEDYVSISDLWYEAAERVGGELGV